MNGSILAVVAFASTITILGCAGGAEQAERREHAERVNFDEFEKKVHSQFGEEGVLAKIFEIIPPTNKYAVEFGAYDGVTASNTRLFITEHGWSSYQIEGDPILAAQLGNRYKENPKVVAERAWVFPGNIEILFEDAGVPEDLDLLIIDIDSNDYYVWRAIRDFRPKVVMLEANPAFPPPQLAVIEFHPMNYWDLTNYVGASLQSLYNLAKKKGYELVHVMRRGPNVIFVDEKYYDRFGIDDNSPVAMWRPRLKLAGDPTEYPDNRQVLRVDAFGIRKKWILDR